jgi:tetratricopeptide (TPR) repeat protein
VALAAMAALWLAVALAHASNPLSPGAVDRMSRETLELSRGRYLATQMSVLLRYLRLFVVPTGLHLDYAFPLRDGFLRTDVLLATCVHVTLLGLAMVCWRRRPVLAYGLLFYYLAHAVESSIIPIRDVIFEHRTYLPNFGLCLCVAWLLVAELPRTARGARLAWGIVPLLLLTLGTTTWRRNQDWRDPIRLWRSNAALAPTKPRVWAILGRYLLEANRPEEGARALQEAVRLRRNSHDPGDDRDLDAINMMWALRLLGRYDEALALNAEYTRRPMAPWVRANFLINEGNVYFDQRRYQEAEGAFRKALEIVPSSVPAMSNLASTCAQTGRLAEAEALYLDVLRIDPDDRVTRFNLWQVRAGEQLAKADALRRAGRTDAALAAYHAALQALEEALRLSPEDAAAGENARQVRALIQALESNQSQPPPGP